jgi:hypothetical protein
MRKHQRLTSSGSLKVTVRRGVTILILVTFVALRWAAQAQSDTFQQAKAAYDTGDFHTAVVLLEGLVEAGVQDSTLHVNLGHAYLQDSNLGHALLNYLRAQRMTPRDRDVSDGITRIRSQRADILGDELDVIHNLASSTESTLTITELSIPTFIMWTGWFGLLLVYILRAKRRSALLIPLVLLGVMLAFCLMLLGSRLYVEANRLAAVVVTDIAPVMSGPGRDYLELYRLSSAAELRIVEERGEWIRFILPNGRPGWIARSYIERVAPP